MAEKLGYESLKLDFDNYKLSNELLDIHNRTKIKANLVPERPFSNRGGDQLHLYHESIKKLSAKWPSLLEVKLKILELLSTNEHEIENDHVYMWININDVNSYNILHHHGSDNTNVDPIFCFIYYVNVPINSGNLIFRGKTQVKIVQPFNGLLIKFPCRLEHAVEPNFSDFYRISIAGNVYDFNIHEAING